MLEWDLLLATVVEKNCFWGKTETQFNKNCHMPKVVQPLWNCRC